MKFKELKELDEDIWSFKMLMRHYTSRLRNHYQG